MKVPYPKGASTAKIINFHSGYGYIRMSFLGSYKKLPCLLPVLGHTIPFLYFDHIVIVAHYHDNQLIVSIVPLYCEGDYRGAVIQFLIRFAVYRVEHS